MAAVLDHWTSGADGSTRQVMFRPGDALQWHAIVQGNPADPNQRILLRFIVESVINATAVDDSVDLELIYRPQFVPEGSATIGSGPAHGVLQVDSVPAGPFRLRGSREDVVRRLSIGDANTIFISSLYSFRVYIVELDAPGRPFAVSEPWHYEIGTA